MPLSEPVDVRLTRLEERHEALHEKVDRLVVAVENHIATNVRWTLTAMGTVILLLLSVLGVLLWPFFAGGP